MTIYNLFSLSADRNAGWAHGRALAAGNATLTGSYRRGIDLTGSVDIRGALGAEAGHTAFAMLQAEGRTSAGLSIKAGFPIDLFGEWGVVARVRAQAAASAAIQGRVGLRSDRFAALLKTALPQKWGRLVEIFGAEFELSAALWGVLSFSAEVVAEAALVGHLIPVGGVEPGFTCSYQYAAGWGKGVGYDFKVNFGLANPARLFERLGVHTADLLVGEVRARNPQLSPAAERALEYLPLFLPLAYQAAFGYGAALAEAARTGAAPDGHAVTRALVRQARTLVARALFDLAFRQIALAPRSTATRSRVAALTGDEAARASDALERLQKAIETIAEADSSASDWFKLVLNLLDALASAEPYLAEAHSPGWRDALALIWAAAVLLRRLAVERDEATAALGEAPPAPGAVAVYIAGKLGRPAGVISEAEALAYLIRGGNVWVQELLAQAPQLAPAIDLIAQIVAPAGGSGLLEALFDPQLTADSARREAVLKALVKQAGPVIEQELLEQMLTPLEQPDDKGVRDLVRLVVRPLLRCLVRVILPAAVEQPVGSRSQLVREQISAALLQTIARLLLVGTEVVAHAAAEDGARFLNNLADDIAAGRAAAELERIIVELSAGAANGRELRGLFAAPEVAELVRLVAETIAWWDQNERRGQFDQLIELATLGLSSGNKTMDDIWAELEREPNAPPQRAQLEAFARASVELLGRLAGRVFSKVMTLIARAGERLVTTLAANVDKAVTAGLKAAREMVDWLHTQAANLKQLLDQLNGQLARALNDVTSRLSGLARQIEQLASVAVAAVQAKGWSLVDQALASSVVVQNLPDRQRAEARGAIKELYDRWFRGVAYLLEEPLRMFYRAADWVREALNLQVPDGMFERERVLRHLRDEAAKQIARPLSLPRKFSFTLLGAPITIDLSKLMQHEVGAATIVGILADALVSSQVVQQAVDGLIALYREIRDVSQKIGAADLAYRNAFSAADAAAIVDRMVTNLPLAAQITAPAETQLARDTAKVVITIPGANATFVRSSLGVPARVRLLVNGVEHSYAPESWVERAGSITFEAWLVPSTATLAPVPVLPDVRILEVDLPQRYTYMVEQGPTGIQRLRAAIESAAPIPMPTLPGMRPANGGVTLPSLLTRRLEQLRARAMTAQMDPFLAPAQGASPPTAAQIQPVVVERIARFAATPAERFAGTRWVAQGDLFDPMLETIVARPGINQVQVVVADGTGRMASISRTFLLV